MPELDEPIHLIDWNPEWPDLFFAEQRRIAPHLPVGVALEHIGSTAVPGLLSKPIIDIMLGAPAVTDSARYRSTLASMGYEDMGEAGVSGRLYFRRRTTRASNVHIVQHDGPLWVANLALRDYLRATPAAVQEYAVAKRAAAERGGYMLVGYSIEKHQTVERLVRRALEWSTTPS